MSHTYTRKVHQGEIDKKKYQEQQKEIEKARIEEEEAAKWRDGDKPTGHEERQKKEEEKKKKKELLKELYEKEMENK